MNRLLLLALLLAGAGPLQARPASTAHEMTINTSKRTATVQPTMYGIFFEDINYAADGGLYGELVKNRSFEFPDHYMGWNIFGQIELRDDGPFERNPHYVRLRASGHGHKHTGLENEGYFGIGYAAGAEYRFTVWARVPDGGEATLDVMLCDPATQGERQPFAERRLVIDSPEWKQYETVLTADQTVDRGTLRLMLRGTTTVDLEHVSLFPVDTWNGHRNGMRKDLAQALYDLHPGVFRFPGGCIVEGTDLDTRYQWKNSVGPVENRPLNENRWHYTFTHRFFPDYFQSYGLGFYEYFLLSEEIGAEPLPVVNVGLVCQYQNHEGHVPADELQPYIDDVLDLIEFANGDPATNEWAALRAEMGHPAPFGLKFVAIGNEQWGEIYCEHLAPFIEQVRAKYPDIQIIGSSGPDSEGEKFDYLWPEMRRLQADLVDEHFYRPDAWFLAQGNRYDNYPRQGTKVFAGEYACHTRGKKWNHFGAALCEAAFMTGLERNADVVEMATYAPLFAHIDGWQWRPDLIWFDNLRTFRSCSYYVQQLYACNRGTQVLPLTMNGRVVSGQDGQDGLFASAVIDDERHEIIVKVVNTSELPQPLTLRFDGKELSRKRSYTIVPTTFTADDPDGENTLDDPERYHPVTGDPLPLNGAQFETTLAPASINLYRIAL